MIDSSTSRIRRIGRVGGAYLSALSASIRRTLWKPDLAFATSEGWIAPDHLRIFWFVQVYRDLWRLRRTLSNLKILYPDSLVLVVSDGDDDPNIPSTCREYGVEFEFRPRLIGVEHGGEVVQWMLEAFLRTDSDLLIKVDPDTDVRRRFALVPPSSDSSIYGTVQSAHVDGDSVTSIQGGCIMVPRAAAKAIAMSSLLLSERLKPPAVEWAVGRESRDRARAGLTSYDWTIGWICRNLRLPVKDHPEVFCRHKPSLIDLVLNRRAAVTHPRFELQQFLIGDFYFRGLRTALRDALTGPQSDLLIKH